MHETVTLLLDLKRSPVPLTRYFLQPAAFAETDISLFNEYVITKLVLQARKLLQQVSGKDIQDADTGADIPLYIEYLRNAAHQCTAAGQANLWVRQFFILVKATLPYLSRAEMETLLARIRPECPAGLTEFQQLWLELIHAVNTEEHAQVINLTQHLLAQPDNTLLEEQQYLLALQLLGLFMQGRDGEFIESYNQHTGPLFGSSPLPIEIEILHKHVLARGK